MNSPFSQSGIFWSVGVALAVALPALAVSSSGCSRSVDRPLLAVHLSSEPVSLDPAFAEDGIALRILANTMEGLFGYDSEGKLQHRLAESHTVSPDGLRYTFRLRSNARWTDGQPVTAQQFLDGLRRSLGPQSTSKLAPLLSMVRGAERYRKGNAPDSDFGVTASAGELTIELERSAPHLLHALTLPIAFAIRKDILAANSGKWPLIAPSTGPYAIAAYSPDRKIALRRNPHYYDEHSGPEQVEFVVVNDETTAANLFDQGKLDILTKLPPADYARMKASGVVRTDPFFATYFLSFNTRKPPFNDRESRRAVSAAINREQIVSILESGETPAYRWLPPALAPELAAKSSIAAHITPKLRAKLERTPPVSAGFDGNTRNSLIMQKVQRDVHSKLGLKMTLQNTDWKSHVRSIQTETPAIYRFGWQAPFHDPISHLRAFTSQDPNNYSGWKNAEYDQLVTEIEATPPGPERSAKILRAETLLVDEEAAVVPIYHYVQNHAVSKRVRDFRANPFGMIFFRELRLQE